VSFYKQKERVKGTNHNRQQTDEQTGHSKHKNSCVRVASIKLYRVELKKFQILKRKFSAQLEISHYTVLQFLYKLFLRAVENFNGFAFDDMLFLQAECSGI
jgi:hypothetical protein